MFNLNDRFAHPKGSSISDILDFRVQFMHKMFFRFTDSFLDHAACSRFILLVNVYCIQTVLYYKTDAVNKWFVQMLLNMTAAYPRAPHATCAYFERAMRIVRIGKKDREYIVNLLTTTRGYSHLSVLKDGLHLPFLKTRSYWLTYTEKQLLATMLAENE